jgi:hypothetical protein
MLLRLAKLFLESKDFFDHLPSLELNVLRHCLHEVLDLVIASIENGGQPTNFFLAHFEVALELVDLWLLALVRSRQLVEGVLELSALCLALLERLTRVQKLVGLVDARRIDRTAVSSMFDGVFVQDHLVVILDLAQILTDQLQLFLGCN